MGLIFRDETPTFASGKRYPMTLDKLKIGESARVTAVGGKGTLRQHILDMGVIPGCVVKLTKLAPLGDPMEFVIRGYTLSLRKADAAKIEIIPAEPEKPVQAPEEPHEDEHPGYGEGGKYHDKSPLAGLLIYPADERY